MNLSKNNDEEEEEEDTEKETDEEEEEENVVVDIDEDEERTRIELVKAARRESATKPPRSPLRRKQRETRGTTSSEEEEAIKATEEGRSGVGLAEATEVIEERSAGPAKGKNAMEVKKGFLNEKRLSSNGLFGDEERVEEDRDARVLRGNEDPSLSRRYNSSTETSGKIYSRQKRLMHPPSRRRGVCFTSNHFRE